jgi:regulatory protein
VNDALTQSKDLSWGCCCPCRLRSPFRWRKPATAFRLLVYDAAQDYAAFVRSSPRKLSTESDLYASALRALMRRAHSIHEMKQYLNRRADDAELIPPLIARLRESNYLDDARYALEFARTHAKSRRQGRFRITRELRTRGVPDQHIEAALDAVFAETDEAALVRTHIKRRLASNRGGLPLDQKKIASLYRSLLRNGFSSELIRAEMHTATKIDADALPTEFASADE